MAAIFNELIEEGPIPEWLTVGITFLIPKNENTEYPKNYRPVTCLLTIYKLLTSIISKRIQKYLDDKNLLPKEQKFGCKDQLLLSKGILQDCKRRKKLRVWHGSTTVRFLTRCHIVG